MPRQLSPFPVYMTRGLGPRKWDVDGQEYIDYRTGHGSMILGQADPAVVAAVQEQMSRGTHLNSSTTIGARRSSLSVTVSTKPYSSSLSSWSMQSLKSRYMESVSASRSRMPRLYHSPSSWRWSRPYRDTRSLIKNGSPGTSPGLGPVIGLSLPEHVPPYEADSEHDVGENGSSIVFPGQLPSGNQHDAARRNDV